MKYKDIQQVSDGELKKMIEETRDIIRSVRFALSVGKMKENNKHEALHRDLARFLTEQISRKSSHQLISPKNS